MSNDSRRTFIKAAATGIAGLGLGSRVLGAPPTSVVYVELDGLMVFHKNGDEYEVGVVGQSIAADHTFSILMDGRPVKTPAELQALISKGNSWRLEVINASSGQANPKDIKPVEIGHPDPLHDTFSGQNDFSWVIDFGKFHGKTPTLKPGLLKPIIHMSHGTIYTKYKIERIDRKRRNGGNTETYGFIAATVGLDVPLHSGEELVLRLEDGTKEKVFPPVPFTGKDITITIENVANHDEFPFDYYYCLFDGISDDEKYDVDLHCQGHRLKTRRRTLHRRALACPTTAPKPPAMLPPCEKEDLPRNPFPPRHKIRDYPCGGIGLIQSDPLK